MKFVRFEDWRTGLLIEDSTGGQIVDVAHSAANGGMGDAAARLIGELLPQQGYGSWKPLMENWGHVRPVLDELLSEARGSPGKLKRIPMASTRLLPPLADKNCRIFAIGGNLAQHVAAASPEAGTRTGSASFFAAEKAQGMPPWGFMVLTDTVAAHDDAVGPPPDVQRFDYEAEVAIVLGSGGKDIGPRDLKIWGYTAWNDLSIRDPRMNIGPLMDRAAFTWGLEKNFDRSHPSGPCLVVDEAANVNELQCEMRVNGEVRQRFSTSEMIWSFADTVQHISHYLTLKPGDMVASGTGAGTAIEAGRDGNHWLKPGDRLEVDIEGVGILRNRVIDWTRQ